MALPKLFQRIFWHNDTTPAINEDNLNAMSKAIDDIDDRLIALIMETEVKNATPKKTVKKKKTNILSVANAKLLLMIMINSVQTADVYS